MQVTGGSAIAASGACASGVAITRTLARLRNDCPRRTSKVAKTMAVPPSSSVEMHDICTRSVCGGGDLPATSTWF